jgi:hypothetical protein
MKYEREWLLLSYKVVVGECCQEKNSEGLNIYILFSLMNSTTSCLWSAITTLNKSRLIELVPLNEWTWCYEPQNWARLNPNERCAFPVLTSGCSQRQWCRSCSDEALKVGNSVIDDCVLIMQKPFFFFFVCSHFKTS